MYSYEQLKRMIDCGMSCLVIKVAGKIIDLGNYRGKNRQCVTE